MPTARGKRLSKETRAPVTATSARFNKAFEDDNGVGGFGAMVEQERPKAWSEPIPEAMDVHVEPELTGDPLLWTMARYISSIYSLHHT
ncbi:unnamed protein product [Notodromas monacha]|uniref:Uncharacterized protein n=1 Tax=Notodromas monacha TaxID=399045 RepID=A0A7R9BPF2_9CRUS|nr:unnamed protein product [Notodromas monacha]CAG0918182.1 unnamed protein product [Notodromas monacha]